VAIHLNDTHPAIGVAELMRLLCDEHGMPGPRLGDHAAVFSYTNHTLMPEALETWPVALMQHVLPRHLEIIFRINKEFLEQAAAHTGPGDTASWPAVADRRTRRAPRAHGAPVDRGQPQGQRRVGTALDLLVRDHLCRLRQPVAERFTNMTNGVTPRRWLAQANPGWRRCSTPRWAALAARPGPAGSGLRAQRRRCGVPAEAFRAVKRANKAAPGAHHRATTGIVVDPTACSTCRSSASTNTSASCSTCCMW
jgi:starch phosphorylase